MAKVVLLSGSPNAEGNTKQVLDQCKTVIEQEGLEAELISLHGKEIKGCVACRQCKKTGRCAIDDDLNEIVDKIRDVEGFIVGSPVYFGTARGDTMNFLQRMGMMSKGVDHFLSWKVGGPIAVARRGGVTASYQEMLMFYFINEMIVPGSDYWNIVFGKGPGDAMNDEEGLNTSRKFASNVAKLIKKIN